MKSKNVALKSKVSAKSKAKAAPKEPAAKLKSSSAAPAFEPLRLPKGVLLGAHTSIAGGVSQAVPRAQACGFTAAQIFVKNNKQWFAPPLAKEEITAFLKGREASGIIFCAHNSYLINLASQDPKMFDTSIKAMIAELERAESLELPFIVMHPGSHGGAGEEAGLKRIAEGLDKIIKATPKFRCKMALEVTAGQGTALGYKLEHLSLLSKSVIDETRLGFCLDTAHLYAAGYNLRTSEGYQDVVRQVKNTIGTERVLGMHLNDSKVPLARGWTGMNTSAMERWDSTVSSTSSRTRWAKIPKVLETPKGEDMREDVVNLTKLAPYMQSL